MLPLISKGQRRGGRRSLRPRLVTFYTVLGLISFIIGVWTLTAWPRSPSGGSSGLQQLQQQDLLFSTTASEPQSIGSSPRRSTTTKPKVLAVIGVFTGYTTVKPWHPLKKKYDYVARRKALRATWFPPTREALARLEAEQGIVLRFVVGGAPGGDKRQEGEIAAEEVTHGGFLHVPLEENYNKLTSKTMAFLKAAVEAYDAEYIIKASIHSGGC
jgi:hypothetical protein